MRRDQNFLVDGADSAPLHIAGRVRLDRLPVRCRWRPGLGGPRREKLQHRALARAVLAKNGVDRAGSELQGGVAQARVSP
jgi:hypothetical protein